MSVTGQLILILSALGAINGFLFALYLWLQQPKKIADRFLAAMLVMLSIRVLKSVLFFFNPEIAKVILQIGLSACLLIGPLLYFYCLSQLNLLASKKLSWKVHFAMLLSVLGVVGAFYPYQQYEYLWGYVLYKAINYVWLFYILLALKSIFPTLKRVLAPAKLAIDDVWLITVFSGNFLIWLAYFTASYTSYIVGAMTLSFIFLLICLSVGFKLSRKVSNSKYADKKIHQGEASVLIEQLHNLMCKEELFKNSLISMPQVAKRLGMSTPRFSQLLNDNLNKSFSTFINELRVEAAKAMLSASNPPKTEVISGLCGFNTQSTFYSVFKKITSRTPAAFKAEKLPKL